MPGTGYDGWSNSTKWEIVLMSEVSKKKGPYVLLEKQLTSNLV